LASSPAWRPTAGNSSTGRVAAQNSSQLDSACASPSWSRSSFRCAAARPWSSGGCRPLQAGGATDHAFGGQPIEQRRRLQAEEAGDGNAALGDDDLMTLPRPLQPVAEVGAELAECHIHASNVQDQW
jgi:hypothetical protein